MATTKPIQYEPGKPIRVFLASPGDVPDERAFVRDHLREILPNTVKRLGQRDIAFEVVRWDDEHDPLTMPAHLTPQQAVIQFKGAPRDCDIVIVIVASRLGTHLSLDTFRKPDGTEYQSGTEWEFLDAWTADPQPLIFVFRRTDLPDISANDLDLDKTVAQLKLVRAFFATFTNPDGSARGGCQTYRGIEDFKTKFRTAMETILQVPCEPTEAIGIRRKAASASQVTTALTKPLLSKPIYHNPVAGCAEILLSPTQGSNRMQFDLCPEVRFGDHTIQGNRQSHLIGVRQASLLVTLSENAAIIGPRLGDRPHRHIRTKGGNEWEILGPIEDGILRRRVIGDEPLCVISAVDSQRVGITLQVSCKQKDLELRSPDEGDIPSARKRRIRDIFIKKHALGWGVEAGMIRLCSVEADIPGEDE